MEAPLSLGDLVVPVHADPSFMRRHGFGILMEIDTSRPHSLVYIVKFPKSTVSIKFTKDALKRYE